mmetsp:Transcript_79619/g.131696  ORF Transcript_79619/g.131696 Transcript_79619/m.131696 type:complete len:301 (+) Transcript_79619:53-955(+)
MASAMSATFRRAALTRRQGIVGVVSAAGFSLAGGDFSSCDGSANPGVQGTWPYSAPAPAMGWRTSQVKDEIGRTSARCRVEAKTFGKGAAHATCINPTQRRQHVRIPRGYLFEPESSGMQTLIVEKDTDMWIEPGKEASIVIDAYCGFSKNSIPRGPMRLTGLQAPSDVLASQSSVWRWTRPYEPAKPKSVGGRALSSIFQAFSGPRPAAEEKKVLQQSYGIDAAKHKALKAELEKIDKDPKRYQRGARPSVANKALPTTAPAAPKTPAAPPATKPPSSSTSPGTRTLLTGAMGTFPKRK